MEPRPEEWKCQVLSTGPRGNPHKGCFFFFFFFFSYLVPSNNTKILNESDQQFHIWIHIKLPPEALVCFCFVSWCGQFLTSLLNVYNTASVCVLVFFGCEACEILAPRPGVKLGSPELKGKVSITGWPGKCRGVGLNQWQNHVPNPGKLQERIYQPYVKMDWFGEVRGVGSRDYFLECNNNNKMNKS